MNAKTETLNLLNICKGAVPEIFQRELKEVLKNISDPNTDPEKSRKITLTFEFNPSTDRAIGMVSMTCQSKLAACREVEAVAYFGEKDGEHVAYPREDRQADMFDGAKVTNDDDRLKVVPFNSNDQHD